MIDNVRKQAFIIFAAAIVLGAGACEEDVKDQYRVTVNEVIDGSNCKWQAVAGATVKLYATEEDYLFDEHVVAETQSDNVGRALFNVPAKAYWYSAFKGENTHHRFAQDVFYENVFTETDKLATCILSPKPVQLQLRLIDQNLKPIGEGYRVTIFNTEADFINDMRSASSVYSFNCLRIQNFRQSDAEGIVLFPNLEAKEYWFIVEGGSQKLKTSIVKTPQPLQNNVNIVNSLDVIVSL